MNRCARQRLDHCGLCEGRYASRNFVKHCNESKDFHGAEGLYLRVGLGRGNGGDGEEARVVGSRRTSNGEEIKRPIGRQPPHQQEAQ